jgi:hypothetical protein
MIQKKESKLSTTEIHQITKADNMKERNKEATK